MEEKCDGISKQTSVFFVCSNFFKNKLTFCYHVKSKLNG